MPDATDPTPPDDRAQTELRIRQTDHEEHAPTLSEMSAAEAEQRLYEIEHALRGIESLLNAEIRRRSHWEFSSLTVVAAILQVFAAGLFAAAVLDWLFQSVSPTTQIKLLCAGVLQIGVLTALVASRDRGDH